MILAKEKMEMKGLRLVNKSLKPALNWVGRLNGKRKKSKAAADHSYLRLSDSGLNLSVMSFNIRRGTARDGKNHWIFRRNLVSEVLKQHRPDVLGLQEALDFQIAEICAMLPGYEIVNVVSSGDAKALHNAILYNAARFAVHEEGTFWYSDTPDVPRSKGWGNIMPRNCTWARLVEKSSGQALYFYNTHLDHISHRSRKKSVILLSRRIAARSFPDTFIVTGDFNARERSLPIQYLKGKILLNVKPEGRISNPTPLVDTFRVRYPRQPNAVTFHGYRRFLFRFKLDYIFVPSSIRVHDAQIIKLRRKKCYPSDHFPLFTNINLPTRAALAKPH